MPFAALGLPAPILKGLRAAGYTAPTAIQGKAIPVVLSGNDLIGTAQSGTGKTASYLLPVLARLLEGSGSLRAIVLTATRELAAKVETHARDLARYTDLRIAVVHSGTPLAAQEKVLRQEGVDLLVATPARLLELHAKGAIHFERVEIVVLDEGDRMIEAGLSTDLKQIIKLLPETRQTLMFTASMPPELNRVAKEALLDPVRVDLAPAPRPGSGLTQAIYPVPRHLKTELLDELLTRSSGQSIVVFTATEQGADRLARHLQRRGYSAAALHDNRSQTQRERALDDLKRGRIEILVATDVVSRGIHVEGIVNIVNYDVPPTAEDYVHRIGPSGAEAAGNVATLMSPEEQTDVASIERFMGRSVPRVMLPDFDYEMRPAEIKRVLSYAEDKHSPPTAPTTARRPLKRSAAPVSKRRR